MVSVIIPTSFGGFEYLVALLPALAKDIKDTNSELIIVDNASKDGTVNYLVNYDCTVRLNPTNLGFAKANNQAARIAQGDYLLLLNNDTVISPGLIKEMQDTFNRDPEIGIVGCCIYLADQLDSSIKIQHAGVMFTDQHIPYELGQPMLPFTPGILPNDERVLSVREVPSVTFACVMIKREVWDKVGGLDEEYQSGWEDSDFVLKARELGYKVWYTGKTSIKHRKHGTPGRMKHEAENRARYDSIWVNTGRAAKVLKGFLNG